MRNPKGSGKGGDMQCNDLLDVLEREGLAPLPEAASEHLVGCPACQGLLADFSAITAAAHELPAEVEPPARVWISLRNQLVAEGLIREAATVPEMPHTATESHSWWHGFSGLLQGRALATAAVGLLIIAAGIAQLRQQPITSQPPPPHVTEQAQAPDALAVSGAALTEQEHV